MQLEGSHLLHLQIIELRLPESVTKHRLRLCLDAAIDRREVRDHRQAWHIVSEASSFFARPGSYNWPSSTTRSI